MSRIGNVYADLAIDFVRSFPIGTGLTVKEFDQWGIAQKEMNPLDSSYDSCPKTSAQWVRLLTERNDLRKKINSGACSAAFGEAAVYPAFSIHIVKHGEDYEVRNALDSYETLAQRLPRQVLQLATTKRERTKRLLGSVDFALLGPGHQISIQQLDRHIRLLLKDIQRRIDDFNEEYADVQEQIRKLGLKPKNSGLIGFMGESVEEEDSSDIT